MEKVVGEKLWNSMMAVWVTSLSAQLILPMFDLYGQIGCANTHVTQMIIVIVNPLFPKKGYQNIKRLETSFSKYIWN